MSKEKGEDDELTHFSQPSLIKDPVTFSCSDESIMLRSLGSSVLNRSTRRSSAIPFRQWPDRRRLAMSVRSSYGSSRTCDGGRSATSESQSVWVDLLPPLNLHKSSGKVVLERSELGKSCLRNYATSFAEGTKFARDIFCQKRQKMRVTSFVRDAHISFVWYTRAS
jgi:hypothetical protein